MKQTILITGASSGFGHASAQLFLDRGWHVLATMRNPQSDLFGAPSERLRVLPLDVTSPASIASALTAGEAAFGPIDAVVNNAGIGVVGAFEATPMTTVRDLFETNTFGVMNVSQAVVGRFRERGSGTLVNVTSSVTLARMPLAAAYTASKAAIEGFTGSLAFEMEAFGVKVKLVEPGYGPTTRFAANGAGRMAGLIPPAYAAFAEPIFAAYAKPALVTTEAEVAETIWRAVHDGTGQLRFPAGADAVALAQTR